MMQAQFGAESSFPFRRLGTSDGLNLRILPNGCIYSIEHKEILINQLLASPLAGGIHRLYLRTHLGDEIRHVELIGPRATSALSATADSLVWSGAWQGLHYRCTCRISADDAWAHQVEIENKSGKPVHCDLVMLQDLGIATRGQVRNNELFTSQYIDHSVVEHADLGYVLMSRQNLAQPQGAHPWLLQGCSPRAAGFLTDGLEFFGPGHRGDGVPAALLRKVIGNRICQGEAGYVAIQSSHAELAPSRSFTWSFFARFIADHPDASSSADLEQLPKPQLIPAESASDASAPLPATQAQRSLFQTAGLYPAADLSQPDIDRLFPGQHRHVETAGGRLMSFFHGDDSRHVVLRAKELSTARAHGHIMRAGTGMMPDDELMSCSCYASGLFASQLTMGNSSLAKLFSGVRDSFNVVRSSGMRIFVRSAPTLPWQLLTAPSAFEMAQNQCRWFYQSGANLLTIRCLANDPEPAFTFDIRVEGNPIELLIAGETVAGPMEYDTSPRVAFDREKNRITVRPDEASLLAEKQPDIAFHLVTASPGEIQAMGSDELLFADGKSRGYPYLTIQTRPTNSFTFTVLGTLNDPERAQALCTKYESPNESPAPLVAGGFWRSMTSGIRVKIPACESGDAIQDALEWFARDAVVHLSVPRGLDQPNGGAWGVRDVCQGPVEFLLSYGHDGTVAEIIRRLFSRQYQQRGDWPQWFMFPPFQEIQASDAHGDVLIWPLKALCDYLEETNDESMLHEQLPYIDDQTGQPTEQRESVVQHVDRLLRTLRHEFLPGTALPRYGEGDWDDSLQPADPALRERMVSSWTAALVYQTLRRYAVALSHFADAERAAAVDSLASQIEADFQRYLIADGIVAGLGIFEGNPARPVEYLLHPSDARTGIRYRLISMTRGILSGIFSDEQAQKHVELIREHLLYPDGARLMDRPTRYQGGVERVFRRSESAACFGREIGLQYVHAHLRYAEAMARMGRADDLWRALLVVNPIAVSRVVPNARARQRNCYFSSSDGLFADRYEAAREYAKLRRGEIPTAGGWRIYSSGPGIYTGIIVRHLYGIRRYFEWMEFDPILPRELNGASCELTHEGRRVRYDFTISCGDQPRPRISINGVPLPKIVRAENPHRPGAIRILRREFEESLREPENAVRIEL